jgi:anti-sigma regulatory factor (Ser/Thr protein kinase)
MRTAPPSPLRLRLQVRAESARLLRRRISLWLDELGASSDDVFDVSLAASEAFENAVEHPHAPTARVIDVDGTVTGRMVTLTIRDHGTWRDERRREEGGYGFPLMRRLVETIEVDRDAEGTAITLRRRLGLSAGARPAR